MSFYSINDDDLIKILKQYNQDCDDSLNDYPTIIKRAEVDTEWNDVKFTFAYGYIILDIDTLEYKEGAPINAVSQTVLDNNVEDELNKEMLLNRHEALL